MILPANFIQRFDRKGLQRLLMAFFLLLAVPTGVLIWQAYGQLKWESFYQHRITAESLTRRVDGDLMESMENANSRTFADYAFLIISGEPSANFVQQSQLSSNPPVQDIPGTIGYFQVDANGAFSTPLLPPNGTSVAQFGISEADFQSRSLLADQIQSTLARNRLVSTRTELRQRPMNIADMETAATMTEAIEEKDDLSLRDQPILSQPKRSSFSAASPPVDYDQGVFDKLGKTLDGNSVTGSLVRSGVEKKRSDLGLDESYELKSEAQDLARIAEPSTVGSRKNTTARSVRRKEQTAMPEAEIPAPAPETPGEGGKARILTFESEIDPFEVSMLDDGHLVAYRNVWRDSERIVQGMLIDATRFYAAGIRSAYLESSISGIAGLAIAHQGELLSSGVAARRDGYASGGELKGSLLYRSRLTAPLDGIELVFSIDRLPPGPGAQVLGWVTMILALVLAGGFAALYRLGLGQIALARQQQDFVSAVSHELKTPLTSIRMYGEMLKEGWADDDKRQSYYEYIHDESERLTRLISNVLQLSRITRSDTQFDIKPMHAGQLMNQLESKLGSQINRAGFALEIERSADDAVLEIDEDSFMQIMINLVDNGLKFSKSADTKVICIACRKSGDDHVQFEVRDYGPGIEKGQFKKIFTMFYRPESELTRESVGTGIGLAIVQQLTQAMGGRVDVVNEVPGARFSVIFPIS